MRQKRAAGTGGGEKTIRDIRRATRRQYSAEEKIRIVLDGLRGEDSIAPILSRQPHQQGITTLRAPQRTFSTPSAKRGSAQMRGFATGVGSKAGIGAPPLTQS